VQVRCGTVPLFEGRVGRRKDRVAVRIERDVMHSAGTAAAIAEKMA
jgi:flagellar motor switch protein FliM